MHHVFQFVRKAGGVVAVGQVHLLVMEHGDFDGRRGRHDGQGGFDGVAGEVQRAHVDAGHEVSDGFAIGRVVQVPHGFGGLFGHGKCRGCPGLQVVPDLPGGFVQGKAPLSNPVESDGAFVKGRVDPVKEGISLFFRHVRIESPAVVQVADAIEKPVKGFPFFLAVPGQRFGVEAGLPPAGDALRDVGTGLEEGVQRGFCFPCKLLAFDSAQDGARCGGRFARLLTGFRLRFFGQGRFSRTGDGAGCWRNGSVCLVKADQGFGRLVRCGVCAVVSGCFSVFPDGLACFRQGRLRRRLAVCTGNGHAERLGATFPFSGVQTGRRFFHLRRVALFRAGKVEGGQVDFTGLLPAPGVWGRPFHGGFFVVVDFRGQPGCRGGRRYRRGRLARGQGAALSSARVLHQVCQVSCNVFCPVRYGGTDRRQSRFFRGGPVFFGLAVGCAERIVFGHFFSFFVLADSGTARFLPVRPFRFFLSPAFSMKKPRFQRKGAGVYFSFPANCAAFQRGRGSSGSRRVVRVENQDGLPHIFATA